MDVGFARKLDIILGLFDINSIKFLGSAFIDKRYIFLVGLLECGAYALIEILGDCGIGGGK